ncbi:hypothetical protein NC651_035306 [Populus alba x Populus x berolinensis]|nr:hypothetical protein NC651_035306 [Populus alba x Populus x berolinensis]
MEMACKILKEVSVIEMLGFGFVMVEWVVFPWVSIYRALELLVAVNLIEHESFWKMRDAYN